MTPMEWHKINSYRWLTGSIRQDLTSEERGVWADLLAMASLSRRRGYVERSEGIGFGRKFIASFLAVPIELLNSTISKCVSEGRIQKHDGGVLFITHFEEYQAVPEDKQKHFTRKFVTELESELKQDAILVNTIETNPKKILSYADRIAKRKGVNPLTGEIKKGDG